MLRRLLYLFAAAMAILGPGLPAQAEPLILSLDPTDSQVTFTLGATGHTVEGTLHIDSGQLVLDPVNGTAQGEIVVDAVRTETGNDRRDKKMHKEVLLSVAHPRIVFEAKSLAGEVSSEGSSAFALEGTVRLIGKDHPMEVQVELEMDVDRFEGQCEMVIPFTKWGLKDPSVLFLRVDKEVQVTVQAVGTWTVEGEATPSLTTEPSVR